MRNEKKQYLPETRDGFRIEGMMKRAWEVQLDMLKLIDRICKRHHLRYFADGGTLLGAVRHKGFIPWDDDVDIVLLRPDFDQLLYFLERELPEGYMIQYPSDRKSEKIIPGVYMFCKVFNHLETDYSEKNLEKNHGFPYPCFIDIFPLDGIPADTEVYNSFLETYGAILTGVSYMVENDINITEDLLQKIEKLCNVTLNRDKSIFQQLLLLQERYIKSYSVDDCEFVNILQYGFSLNLHKEYWDTQILLPFEHLELPCPAAYDKVLTAWFGDYMTPVVNQAMHEYPFYKFDYSEMVTNRNDPSVDAREALFAKLMNIHVWETKELLYIRETEFADYYLYFFDGDKCIIRIPGKNKENFFDPAREQMVYQLFAKTNITVNPLLFRKCDGYKVVPALKNTHVICWQKKEHILDGLKLLKKFHSMSFSGIPSEFFDAVSPIDVLHHFLSDVSDLSKEGEYFALYQKIIRIEQYISEYPVHIGISHMRLSSHSFLYYESKNDFRERMVLTDLKYAGKGDVDWDFAVLASNECLGFETIWDILKVYYGDIYEKKEISIIYEKVILYTIIATFTKCFKCRFVDTGKALSLDDAMQYLTMLLIHFEQIRKK